MKKIKFYIFIIYALTSICANANSGNDYLIYVSNSFDKHPTRINIAPRWQWGYWVNQATILKNSSKTIFTTSANCEKGQYGKLILALEPKIFYNPGMTTLYGDITAKIYGHDGKIITSINVEDQTQGIVTVFYEKLVDKLYKKILIQLQNQISTNEAINLYLQKNSAPIEGTFCSIFN
jgi:hypothetical protein